MSNFVSQHGILLDTHDLPKMPYISAFIHSLDIGHSD